MPLMPTSSRCSRLSIPPASAGPSATAAGRAGPRDHAPAHSAPTAEVDSQALLDGRPRIAIRHRQQTYWLQETRQGKLLLTK